MAKTGPTCREICEDCFKRLSPIEESTVGGILDKPTICDLCMAVVAHNTTHHVHQDGLDTPALVDLGTNLMGLLHKQAGWTRVTFEVLPNGEIGFKGEKVPHGEEVPK